MKRQAEDRFSTKAMFETHYQNCRDKIESGYFRPHDAECFIKLAFDQNFTFREKGTPHVVEEIMGTLGWIIKNEKPGILKKLNSAIYQIFCELTEGLGETMSINKSAKELNITNRVVRILMNIGMLRGFQQSPLDGKSLILQLVIFRRDVEVLKKLQKEMPEDFEDYIQEAISKYPKSYSRKRKSKARSSNVINRDKIINLQEWQRT